ncbi:MAG: gamma-glutamyltransferase [Acidimicrobiaceae bacterium]|nr:gamma-glutamyltransferase [Acidimicrobiaceae bacterium]MCY3643085.1 gamma-glutamyltransferase [Acidimicrobiaceae bacterium]
MTAAVATSDPRATDAALEVLRSGGNAVDAAVTACFVLYVVEPQSCGVGGDGFMFVHDGDGSPAALDGSGAVPLELTADRLRELGHEAVPARGGASVTTPGAVALLETALSEHGTIDLPDAVAPARQFARDGFEVRATLASTATRSAQSLVSDPVLGPLYIPGGAPVAEGSVVRNPALAECLVAIAAEGSQAVLAGPIGEAIVARVRQDGGLLSVADLARHETMTAEPGTVEFAEHTVWQMPQPTQGPGVLSALESLTPETPVDWDAVLEATRQGMRAAGFDPAAIVVGGRPKATGDTTFLAVVDGDGQAVSLITSVFGDFGAHLGVAEIGGPIHNRATTLRMLSLEPRPGAKPPHTTIPGLVTRDGRLGCVLGVAGGIMQPQAQVQLIVRMILEGLGPQAAVNRPRFKVCFGGDLALEPGHELAGTHPAALSRSPGPEGFGAAQIVGWHRGRLEAAADARRGGSATVLD